MVLIPLPKYKKVEFHIFFKCSFCVLYVRSKFNNWRGRLTWLPKLTNMRSVIGKVQDEIYNIRSGDDTN